MPGSQKCQELRKTHGLPPVSAQPSVHRILDEIMKEQIAAEMEDPEL
jgi:hypothetical protein